MFTVATSEGGMARGQFLSLSCANIPEGFPVVDGTGAVCDKLAVGDNLDGSLTASKALLSV